MPNLYGVANAPIQVNAVYTIGGADVACPAGAETNIFDTGLLVAPSQGWFFPMSWAVVVLAMGGVVPTTLQFGIRVNGGADQQTFGINTTLFVASGVFMWSFVMTGSASQTLYAGTGGHVQISLNPTGQAVTIRNAGSEMTTLLMRAPDQ